MSITQNIINSLTATLQNITKSNGYQTDVLVVNDKLQKITEVTELITLNVLAGNDKLTSELEINEVRQVEFIILCHCNSEDGDGILTDVHKHIYNDLSINELYTNKLETIANLQKVLVTLKNNNYDWHNNKRTVLIKILVEYIQERNNINGI